MESTSALLIFDGDCGFCTSAAIWTKKGWRGDERIVAFQELGPAGLARVGLSVEDAERAAWWVDGSGKTWRGHRAIAKSLQAGTGARRTVGRVMGSPLATPFAALAYRLAVRYRHRLPGATAACQVRGGSPTSGKV
jgi:predicted DCC family thiol-disulfide oxidoreductase YuxK